MRGAVWCNLLRIKELKDGAVGHLFAKLSELRNPQLEKDIDSDTIVDRSELLVTKETGETIKPDAQKLRKIILAYGNVDIDLGYN